MSYTKKFSTMKPLRVKAHNNHKVFAFDVETKQTDKDVNNNGEKISWKHQEFICGSIVGDGGYQRFFRDREQMQNELLNNHCFRSSRIFATNLDFDFNILFGGSKLLKEFFIVDKAGKFILTSHKKGNYKRMFLDTMNFAPISVEKAGKLIGFPKIKTPPFIGQEPKNQEEWEIMKEYNINDSMVSYKFAKFLGEFFTSINCKMKNTLASSGIDYWRRNWQQQMLLQERKPIIELHYQGSVKGGRTEVFKRGKIQDSYYYDVNSMYPSCMRDGIDGSGSYPFPNSYSYAEKMNDMLIEKEGITFCKVKCPDCYIPFLGVHQEAKLIFPRGEFSGWFTNYELRKALVEGYEILEYGQGIYYNENFIPFRECILSLYDLRQKFKEEGKDAMQMMVKTLMNGGLFGKFAQKINGKLEVLPKCSVEFDEFGYAWHEQEESKRRRLQEFYIRGDYVFEKKQMSKVPFFIYPILSSYTTALSRAKLYDYMKKIPDELVYCDTDSIISLRDKFRSSKELGELKLEQYVKNGIIVRPKCYFIEDDEGHSAAKIKGLPGSYDMSESEFVEAVSGKPQEYSKWTRVKESHIRKLEYGSIIKMQKSLTNEDDKRKWPAKFNFSLMQDSLPLNFTGVETVVPPLMMPLQEEQA